MKKRFPDYRFFLPLVLISLVGFVSHLVQVSFGWGGLYWTTHFFYSLLIAPVLFFLPVVARLIAQPMLRLVFWQNCDSSIFQFKTGTIIFGYMLCEGMFVLIHAKKEGNR